MESELVKPEPGQGYELALPWISLDEAWMTRDIPVFCKGELDQ